MLLALYCVIVCYAQTADSSKQRVLEEVRVTGSQRISNVDNVIDIRQLPMPVLVIDKKTIAAMGSRRLDEVMRGQTGMAIVSDLGAGNRSIGLQMQGFSSEYITILMNGQPMAGRNSGSFDLSRISVSDIERIEIIKGASSSLYGSEALGGVVNIITRQQVKNPQGLVNVLYGTFNTVDATVEAETPFANEKAAAFLSGNYYRTDGFNVDPTYLKQGKTAPPYNSVTLQGRARYQLSQVNTLHLTGRYAGRHSVMDRSYGLDPFTDVLNENDLNGMVALNSQLQSGTRLVSRYYYTRYTSKQQVTQNKSGNLLQHSAFTEQVHKVELQVSRDLWQQQLTLIGGTGGDYDGVNAREGQVTSGAMYNYFAYAQGSWKPNQQVNIIAGARYTGNNLYGGKITPSTGITYLPVSWLTLKASVGQGFKSPTYAQMYQLFTNTVVGYTTIGANNVQEGIATLKAAGQLTSVWNNAGQVTTLKAETSTSWNAGFSVRPISKLEFTFNGFYNDLHNMIYNQQIGIKTNGASLYSWFNIARAYTSGMEAGASWQPLQGLTVSGGYQLLYARDRAYDDSIRMGVKKVRNSVERERTAVPADHFGLPNRSRHMANLQLFYEYKPWGLHLSARGTYRSRYGFLDENDNGFIDPYDVFVNGYVVLHCSARKSFLQERLTLQLTIDNINDYTDRKMPAQAGRMIMTGIAWRCFDKKNKINHE